VAEGKPIRMADYVIFEEAADSSLRKIGEGRGRNANEAVKKFLSGNGGEAHDKPLVIVPQRNLSRVRVEVETVQKVALTAA
jgi:hypothetical protein